MLQPFLFTTYLTKLHHPTISPSLSLSPSLSKKWRKFPNLGMTPFHPQNSPLQHFLILDHLEFLAILLLAFIESYLILLKYDICFHVVPIICILFYSVCRFNLSRSAAYEIFLVDFSCYRPPSFCRIPFSSFIEHTRLVDYFDKDSVEFMSKILHSSGQGPETYLPSSLHFFPSQAHSFKLYPRGPNGPFPHHGGPPCEVQSRTS